MVYTTSFFFNGTDLNTLPGVNVTNYDVTELPTRTLTISKLARRNRSVLTSAEYASKLIKVEGYIGAENNNTLQENFIVLKANVQAIEGAIRVQQGLQQIEYTGTLNALSKEWVGKNIKFVLEFVCSDPIGRAVSPAALFAPKSITTTSVTQQFTVDGSGPALPRLTLNYLGVTSGTNKTVSILNASTGKGIRVTGDFASSDILSIYSDTFEVLLNNVSVDFDGTFPQFEPGAATLQYIDNFGDRNTTLTATYIKQYV